MEISLSKTISNMDESYNSNLQKFLNNTTPVVNTQYLPKNYMRNIDGLWYAREKGVIKYFNLADLWSSYDEWSAYGAGTEINLNNKETVIQYYVPYLSAIQVFKVPKPITSCRDLFGDFVSEDENENVNTWTIGNCSSIDYTTQHESQQYLINTMERPYFQYFESSPPHTRLPLSGKINEFIHDFPDLTTLKSIDVSSSSWMSVAWYPIYHIPAGRTTKDLSACFLTYHKLSSSLQDMEIKKPMVVESRENITLPTFGLATYKMQGSVWFSDLTSRDRDMLLSLRNAADSWIKQLKVEQQDFNFFTSRSYRHS